ncbi:MAG: hypothetical protein Q7S36_03650 [Candidatus Liptonbacteria bacterium]|nr:hypothetical protein [Candidatus Liptonbacteria bacterium]
MEILPLAVVFGEDETRLAEDIFSGKSKVIVLPGSFPKDNLEKFVVLYLGVKPRAALVRSSQSYVIPLSYLRRWVSHFNLENYNEILEKEPVKNPDVEPVFTLAEIEEVKILPMDFTEAINARYLAGEPAEDYNRERYGC